jgi:transposase-like protein
MRYTEEFKKQVVRKVLSPGVLIVDVARKLNISLGAICDWKKLYGKEVKDEIVQIDIDRILHEDPVDIDKLLLDAEPEQERQEGEVLKKIEKGLSPGQYKLHEKYVMLRHVKKLSAEQQGAFLRSYGLQSRHIEQWEDEILAMGKKEYDRETLLKKLEEENKQLRKQLKQSEKEKRELEILIELKKKYHTLFKQDGEE